MQLMSGTSPFYTRLLEENCISLYEEEYNQQMFILPSLWMQWIVLKLPILQEKFSSILEKRMSNNEKIAGSVGICSNATITRNTPVLTTHETPPSKLMRNGNNLLASSLLTLKSGNQENSSIEPKRPEAEQARGNNERSLKASPSPAFTPLAKVPKNSETKRDKMGASNATVVDQPQPSTPWAPCSSSPPFCSWPPSPARVQYSR